MHAISKTAWSLVRHDWKAFAVIEILFFGLFLAMMLLTIIYPDIQPVIVDALSDVIRPDVAAKIYLTGNFVYAACATWVVNMGVAVVLITLPSFAVPFSGVAFALAFAAVYGVILAPVGPYSAALIPHSLAILIEFQAYVIAAFGSYLLGKGILAMPTVNRHHMSQRYRVGTARVAALFSLTAPLLALGAVYEVFEIYFLVRYFVP